MIFTFHITPVAVLSFSISNIFKFHHYISNVFLKFVAVSAKFYFYLVRTAIILPNQFNHQYIVFIEIIYCTIEKTSSRQSLIRFLRKFIHVSGQTNYV